MNIKTIRLQKAIFLIVVISFILSNSVNGQTAVISDFETKVDNYIKLYLPNFDISNENPSESRMLFIIDSLKSTVWTRKVTLKSKQTIQDKNGQTTNLRLNLSFYNFEDSKKCKDAMNVLLNCFGGDCGKIEWGTPGQTAKTTPCVFVFNEREIITCSISCEQENGYWNGFKEDLIKTLREDPAKIMEAGCGGPITFK